MAEKSLQEEMVATYAVSVTGIQRTRSELAKLDAAIRSLRAARYNGPGSSVSSARFGTSRSDKLLNGKKDIFAAKIDMLEGRIQTVTTGVMDKAMKRGKEVQTGTLRAAETKTGRKRAGNGPGRDKTGEMIAAIATNVETQKTVAVTQIVGWHGWKRHRKEYMEYQEQGTKGRKSGQQIATLRRLVKKRREDAAGGLGVPAANSLGASVLIVREELKRGLGALKK